MPLARRLPARSRVPGEVGAFFLTDESYGLTIWAVLDRRGGVSRRWAAIGLCLPAVAVTLAGALLGAMLPDPAALGLDLVCPLCFLAQLRSGLDLAVALGAAGSAMALGWAFDGGAAAMLATTRATGGGVALDRRARHG